MSETIASVVRADVELTTSLKTVDQLNNIYLQVLEKLQIKAILLNALETDITFDEEAATVAYLLGARVPLNSPVVGYESNALNKNINITFTTTLPHERKQSNE